MYKLSTCRNDTQEHSAAFLNNIKAELSVIFNKNHEFENSVYHSVNGCLYQKNLVILEGDILFSVIRKQWKQAEQAILSETGTPNISVYDIRKQVVDILSLCRYSIQKCETGTQRTFLQNKLLTYLKLLKNTITPWSGLEERFLVKLTSSSVRNEELPLCHYFHMYLDVQWLLITLQYITYEASVESFNKLIKDLVILSYSIYKKCNQKDIIRVNTFVCTCIKRLWVLVQLFSEELFRTGIINRCFWEIFNNILNQYDSTFSLWLLHDIALLHGYNEDGEFLGSINIRVQENYDFIECKLKLLGTYFTNITNDNNQMLLNCCKLIEPLLNQWWIQPAKSQPYQILWEMFNKHINLSFETVMVRKSTCEIVEFINQLSENLDTKNSYEYFLFMLVRHLTKFPNQWPRIRGRIYSKLPSHKMNDLNDAGLFNITLLFLSLAKNVNLNEAAEKLSLLLSALSNERRNSTLVLNIHMSIVTVYALQGFSVKEACTPLLQIVEQAANNRKQFYLIRVYIDGFDSILNANQNFNLHQHMLIGSWVSQYLNYCQFNDLCYFLNVLSCNVQRIRHSGGSVEWENALKQHVLVGLKQVAIASNAPSQVGELAALIDMNPSSDHVQIFVADTVAPDVACQYILTLLENVEENYLLTKNYENAILHAWIRCCLLNCENSEKLTRNVMKISALSSVIDIKLNVNIDPLCDFIKTMGKLIATGKLLRELCDQCFGHLDSWIAPHITTPTSESSAIYMYTRIALLFFHCAPLLYHKNRSSCLLNRLIGIFLLPTDILMGKSPHPHVLSAIQQTWHLFVQGIYSLDCSNDAYLERTLRDMVVRYVPFLQVIDCPILKCLDNNKLAEFIFEKIAAGFLSHSSRSSDSNTTKALKIILTTFESLVSIEIIELVLQSTLTAIFEVIMFHSQKNMAVDIIKYISLSDKYEQLKQYVKISFITVTEKHLAFNANKYFQFTSTLVKFIPIDMRELLPSIKKQVSEVERMRGVGYDNILRQGIDRLEVLLKQ